MGLGNRCKAEFVAFAIGTIDLAGHLRISWSGEEGGHQDTRYSALGGAVGPAPGLGLALGTPELSRGTMWTRPYGASV